MVKAFGPTTGAVAVTVSRVAGHIAVGKPIPSDERGFDKLLITPVLLSCAAASGYVSFFSARSNWKGHLPVVVAVVIVVLWVSDPV